MNAQAKNVALAARIFDRLPAGSPTMSPLALTEAARTLRRAQMTLRRWAEEMCNGTIQRDERPTLDPSDHINGDRGRSMKNGRPLRVWHTMGGAVRSHPIPDRERGALARVAAVCKAAGLHWYHQTDPRGCALYVAAEPLTAENYSTKGIPCL